MLLMRVDGSRCLSRQVRGRIRNTVSKLNETILQNKIKLQYTHEVDRDQNFLELSPVSRKVESPKDFFDLFFGQSGLKVFTTGVLLQEIEKLLNVGQPQCQDLRKQTRRLVKKPTLPTRLALQNIVLHFYFYFPTKDWFHTHLKHLGRTRQGELIRPVWL